MYTQIIWCVRDTHIWSAYHIAIGRSNDAWLVVRLLVPKIHTIHANIVGGKYSNRAMSVVVTTPPLEAIKWQSIATLADNVDARWSNGCGHDFDSCTIRWDPHSNSVRATKHGLQIWPATTRLNWVYNSVCESVYMSVSSVNITDKYEEVRNTDWCYLYNCIRHQRYKRYKIPMQNTTWSNQSVALNNKQYTRTLFRILYIYYILSSQLYAC